MTHHRQMSLAMSARLDNSLDKDEDALLQAHLAACELCQAEWASLQRLDRILSSAPMMPAPLRLRVQVMSRLGRRDEARRGVIGGLTLALGTVALVLLMLAPAVNGLLVAVGVAPALIIGGPETLSIMLPLLGVVGRTVAVLAKMFAIPLAVVSLCGVTLTLVANGIWIGMVRHVSRSR